MQWSDHRASECVYLGLNSADGVEPPQTVGHVASCESDRTVVDGQWAAKSSQKTHGTTGNRGVQRGTAGETHRPGTLVPSGETVQRSVIGPKHSAVPVGLITRRSQGFLPRLRTRVGLNCGTPRTSTAVFDESPTDV